VRGGVQNIVGKMREGGKKGGKKVAFFTKGAVPTGIPGASQGGEGRKRRGTPAGVAIV